MTRDRLPSASLCEGCREGVPRVSPERAMELQGRRPGQPMKVPATWSVCMAGPGFHVPEEELEQPSERGRRP